MKTKRLIELLQKEDPTGEVEVCVGNQDIHCLQYLEAYWDGCLEVLKRDETSEYYNIIGAKFVSEGVKISITPLSIDDAIMNDVDLPVEFDSDYTREHYSDAVAKQREDMRSMNKKFSDEFIVKVLQKYKEGWKVAQSNKESVKMCHVQWWWKPGDKRTRRSFESEEEYKNQSSLCQGECQAVIESGFFVPVDDGERIIWELRI
jgi:hypothetical protein